MEKESGFDSGVAWEDRVLCSDESCIGVIGPDGRCKECGRPYEGKLPAALQSGQASGQSVDADDPDDSERDDVALADGDTPDPSEKGDDEWSTRTLCPDESCIGVIGPDGRCKECGRPSTL
jgi:hypothetical protein